ncbi:MAG: HEAT repeat domain-containing protein, partial [Nitrospirales bacterium]
DLRTELVYALGDENRRVREAGFRLAERLKDDQLVDLLLQYARKGESDLAGGAIRCLGRLKSEKALKVLLSLLDHSTDSDRLVSCCRALGQIGNPEAIDPLAAILRPTKWYSLRKRWSPQVRSIAAFALGQIDHPRATGILAEYVNDPDSRVKRVARSRVRRRGEGP